MRWHTFFLVNESGDAREECFRCRGGSDGERIIVHGHDARRLGSGERPELPWWYAAVLWPWVPLPLRRLLPSPWVGAQVTPCWHNGVLCLRTSSKGWDEYAMGKGSSVVVTWADASTAVPVCTMVTPGVNAVFLMADERIVSAATFPRVLTFT